VSFDGAFGPLIFSVNIERYMVIYLVVLLYKGLSVYVCVYVCLINSVLLSNYFSARLLRFNNFYPFFNLSTRQVWGQGFHLRYLSPDSCWGWSEQLGSACLSKQVIQGSFRS
jgi:hypothetical protein